MKPVRQWRVTILVSDFDPDPKMQYTERNIRTLVGHVLDMNMPDDHFKLEDVREVVPCA